MNLLDQTANWLWFACIVLGVLFVFFGLAAAVILTLSLQAANAARLAVLVIAIGGIATIFVAVSFGYNYNYQSAQGGIQFPVTTILLASVTLLLLMFGYFCAFRLIVK